MFDHVVFGVSDYAASKAFFLAALEPLGVAVVLEGPLGIELSTDGRSSLCLCPSDETPGICTWRSSPSTAPRSTRSIAPRSLQAAWTTVRRVFARSTTPATTPRSSSVPTGTTSKRFVTHLRHERAQVPPE